MRNKFRENVQGFLEVCRVPVGQADPKSHVDHAQDDGDFHLERVQENNLVLGDLPDGVHAEGVGSAVPVGLLGRVDHGVLDLENGVVVVAHLPRGSKNVQALAEDVVVDEASVDAKKGHDSDQVPATKEVLPDLVVDLSRFQHLLLDAHVQAEAQHDGAVTGVAEHDGEQEGEGDDGVNGGVGFTVACHSICIDQSLECSSILVGSEESRWGFLGIHLVQNRRHCGSGFFGTAA